VDKLVAGSGARAIWFVLPEGAAKPETEPQVLASAESEPERKFLRAFCCPSGLRLVA